jgi:Icc-related predicted phosphoesterase
VRPNVDAGSTAVRAFIETYQPDYFFCGHIHGAAGTDAQLGKTRGRNFGKKVTYSKFERGCSPWIG